MAESVIRLENVSKEEQYEYLLPQIVALIASERDWIANLANVSAALKMAFDFLWVGFYLIQENELVLGPFQGPVACTRIPFGKGVCGTSWKERRTIVVPDVERFPGHIACNSESKSEIVVPLFNKGAIIGILDIDSKQFNSFDETDVGYLEKISNYVVTKYS
jgi:GAF domain-containing protein